MAAINGVWFLWFDNLGIFLGMMRTYIVIYWLYWDLFSTGWETTVSVYSFCFFIGSLYKNMSWVHWKEQLLTYRWVGFCVYSWPMAKLEQKLKSLYVYEIEKGPYFSLWVWNIFLPSEGINKLDISLLKNLSLNGLQRLISIFLNLIFSEFPGKQWN